MFKKSLVILLCLLMCSCSVGSDKKLETFMANDVLRFEYMETEYSYTPQTDEFNVLGGALKGATVSFNESGCVIRYGELLLKTQPSAMPHLKGLYRLYKGFKSDYDSVVITDDGAYALLIDSSRFLVYYNTDAERIDKLIAETSDGVFEYTVLTSEETD